MDYFLVINGQKQGPFDLIGLIKKIKNGSLTPETQVSKSADGPFLTANQFPDLLQLLNDNAIASNPETVSHRDVKLSFKKYFAEGVDLWARHIVSFSIMIGLILTATFFLSKAFETKLDKNFLFAGNIITTFVATLFCIIFFCFVLLAKRSQKPETKEIKSTIFSAMPSLIKASLLVSLVSAASFFGPMIAFFAWIAATVILSYFAFVPFIIFDSHKKLGQAARLSFSRVAKIGSNNLGVILLLAVFNILMAFLPALAAKDLLGFGLFISLPITVAAYAFVYDEIFG